LSLCIGPWDGWRCNVRGAATDLRAKELARGVAANGATGNGVAASEEREGDRVRGVANTDGWGGE